MQPRALTRLRAALVSAVVACAAAAGAAQPAAAAQQTTSNACQYSYDGYWRDMDVTLGGAAGVAVAQPGQQVTLGGQSVAATLPDWLAQYGYSFGLLEAGYNEIPVTVWVAVRGVNTAERVQVQQVDTVATTTIATGPGGLFASATPIAYSVPSLADTDWTATGGDVSFQQAPSGSMPPLPVGTGGAPRTPRGSVYILARLGDAQLGLDCLPGGFVGGGGNFSEIAAEPFAFVDVPAFQCVNGAAPPAGLAVDPIDVELVRDPATPSNVIAGGAFTTAPRVRWRIPNGYLQRLYDDGALADGANAFSAELTVALAGSGMTVAGQLATAVAPPATIAVAGGGSSISTGSGPDLVGEAVLSPTTWTAAGGAPVGIAAATPGALGALSLDGGALAALPYGSVYARVTLTPPSGPAVRRSLDCVSATVSLANGAIAYSERGDAAPPQGDRGRWTLAAWTLDPFAVVPVDPAPTPRVPPRPPVDPPSSPVDPPAPSDPPRPAVRAATLAARSLTLRRGRVALALRCPARGAATCRGTARLLSAARLRPRRGARARRVVVARAVRYRAAAGRRVVVRLTPTAAGRRLLRAAPRGRLAVRVETNATGGGSAATRVVLSGG